MVYLLKSLKEIKCCFFLWWVRKIAVTFKLIKLCLCQEINHAISKLNFVKFYYNYVILTGKSLSKIIHFFKFFGLTEPPNPKEIPIPSVLHQDSI